MTTEANASRIWRRSTRCSGGGCIEVNVGSSEVGVRDSKNPNSPEITFASEMWRAFINRVQKGHLDRPQ